MKDVDINRHIEHLLARLDRIAKVLEKLYSLEKGVAKTRGYYTPKFDIEGKGGG